MPNFIEELTNGVKNTVSLVIQGTQRALSTIGGIIGLGSAGSETRTPGSETENDPPNVGNPDATKPLEPSPSPTPISAALSVLNKEAMEIKAVQEAEVIRNAEANQIDAHRLSFSESEKKIDTKSILDLVAAPLGDKTELNPKSPPPSPPTPSTNKPKNP